MKITATFTAEELETIALANGRVPEITEMYKDTEEVEGEMIEVTKSRVVQNNETPEEYVSEYYRKMIVIDTSNILSKANTKDLREQIQTITETTEAHVEAKIKL